MANTEDIYGVVVPKELVLPTKTVDAAGRAGTIYLSGGKIKFTPSDGGAEETVTSA